MNEMEDQKMKKVLMLVMVLCLGLLVIPTKAEVFYEVWDAIPPDVDGQGLTAPGFDLNSFGVPASTGLIPNFSDGPRHDTDIFTFRQTAYIYIPVTAEYTIWVDSDDGSIVFVDGVEVAVNDGWHGTNGGMTNGAFAYTAGIHVIEAQMFEDGGGEALIVEFESADLGLARGPIPDNYLWGSQEAKVDPTNIVYPDQAVAINPAHTAVDVPLAGTVLSWTDPHAASQYKVYFGATPLVNDPNAGDKYLVGTVDGTTADMDTLVGTLAGDTTYYWRVDAVAEPNNVIGIAYSFDSMRMAPIITGEPVSATIGDGGCTAAFSVAAISGINEDGGVLTYQWHDSTAALDGETSDTLVTGTEGSYYCMVSNDWGDTASAAASLTIVRFGIPAGLANGLLAYYSFDVDGTDDSGNGVDGTLGGEAAISPGLFGNALDMNGDNGNCFTGWTPTQLGINGNAARSVSSWVYTRSWGSNGGIYDMGTRADTEDFSLRIEGGSPDNDNRWRIQYWGGDYDFVTTDATREQGMIPGHEFASLDNWVHFVHTHDGTHTRIYGNGVLIVEWAKTINTTDTMDWRIGTYGDTDQFDGLIDDVALWNRALTAEEAAALYAAGQVGGTLAGASWAPVNPTPEDKPVWPQADRIDPDSDLTLSWEPAALAPCGDVTYSIIIGTDPVAVADSNAIAFDTTSETSYVLAAANLAVEGEYYWRVDTSYGGDTDKGDVWYFEAIKEIPAVITQPADVFAFPGGTAEFDFVVTSDTPVTYTWYMEVAGDDVEVATGNPGVVTGVGIADDGYYYCIAVNDSGATQSASARLEIAQIVGHWTLDEITEPNTVIDSARYGRNGNVIGGPGVVPGKIGNALDFNGTDQWVDIGLVASELELGGNKARSVSVWVYPRAMNDGGIFDMGNHSGGQEFCLRTESEAHGDHGWRIQYYGGDWDFNTNEPWNLTEPFVDPFPSKDAWVHFVQTHDGTTTRVYGNGQLLVDWETTIDTTDDFTFRFAAYGPGPNDLFDGLIDDLRLYNYALTPNEVGLLYTDVAGGAVCPENPVYDWNGDCETTLADFAILASEWMWCNLVPDCLP